LKSTGYTLKLLNPLLKYKKLCIVLMNCHTSSKAGNTTLRYRNVLAFILFIVSEFFPAMVPDARGSGDSGDSSAFYSRNPKTAVICSAVLPGLGQIYNRKYWKLPLIYGAGGALVYSCHYYYSRYIKVTDALFESQARPYYFIDGKRIASDKLNIYQYEYRRRFEMSILGIAGIYLLNVIDAMVDAYFTGFDVSDKLAFDLRPSVISNNETADAICVKFSFCF